MNVPARRPLWPLRTMSVACATSGGSIPSPSRISPATAGPDDYRADIHPKRADTILSSLGLERPYFQVFADRFGFTPNLSVLDLLFNEGPDSILWLKKL